jgi:Helix-turn-helix domain
MATDSPLTVRAPETDTIMDTAAPSPTVTSRNLDENQRAKPERRLTPPARVLTAREAQAFLKVGKSELWRLTTAGELRGFKLPGRRRGWFYDVADLHAAVDAWREGRSLRRHPRTLKRLAP